MLYDSAVLRLMTPTKPIVSPSAQGVAAVGRSGGTWAAGIHAGGIWFAGTKHHLPRLPSFVVTIGSPLASAFRRTLASIICLREFGKPPVRPWYARMALTI